jgi:hypothetical protein
MQQDHGTAVADDGIRKKTFHPWRSSGKMCGMCGGLCLETGLVMCGGVMAAPGRGACGTRAGVLQSRFAVHGIMRGT